MNEIYRSNFDILKESIKSYRDELNKLVKSVNSNIESKKKGIEKKFPPTDYFGGIRLSKKGTYKVPGVKEILKRTGYRCATNPIYEDSLVMTKNGREQNITHDETYYTDRDVFPNGKQKFPVENIEWRIRKILNEDRERLGLKKIPEGKKVRDYGSDGTIRDMNGYIIVAADKRQFPRGTLIMTTLGPGRVYDVGSKVCRNHIDLFTHWPV